MLDYVKFVLQQFEFCIQDVQLGSNNKRELL